MIADGQPSFTAFTAAAARAAHLIVDTAPVIFADTLAEAMLGERADEYIAFHRAHGTHPILAGARAQATCRSRYAEDSLADGVGRGIGQYVLDPEDPFPEGFTVSDIWGGKAGRLPDPTF